MGPMLGPTRRVSAAAVWTTAVLLGVTALFGVTALIGTAAARQPDDPQPGIEILSASLVRGIDVASWFGAPSEPVVRLTIENTGDEVVNDRLSAVRIGDEVFFGDPISELGPAERSTVDVPVRLGTFQWGRITMIAVVDNDEYVVRPWNLPWALLVIAALAVHLMVLRLRNRLRRRVAAEVAATRAGATDGAHRAGAAPEPPSTTTSAVADAAPVAVRFGGIPEPQFAPDGRALPASPEDLRAAALLRRPCPYDEEWSADPWAAFTLAGAEGGTVGSHEGGRPTPGPDGAAHDGGEPPADPWHHSAAGGSDLRR